MYPKPFLSSFCSLLLLAASVEASPSPYPSKTNKDAPATSWDGSYFPPREAIFDPHTQKKDETPELKVLEMPAAIRKIYTPRIYRDTAPPNHYHQNATDYPFMWWDPVKNARADKLEEAFFGVSMQCNTNPNKSPPIADVRAALAATIGKTGCRRSGDKLKEPAMDHNNRHPCNEIASHESAVVEICGPSNHWLYCANIAGWMKPALDECNHNGRTEAIISVWAGSKTPQSDLSIRFRQKDNAGEKKVVPKVKAVAFKILTIPTSKNSSSTPTVTASPSTASKSALNTNPPDNKDAPVHTTATFTTTITRPTVTSSPMVVAAAAAPRASVTFSAVPSGTPTQIPSSGPRLW